MEMNDNLARQYQYQPNQTAQPYDQPLNKPISSSIRRTVGKKMLTRFEKTLISFILALFVGLSIASVSMSSQLTSVSQELQDINSQIDDTTVINTNLEQNVQELSRYDRVHQIGEEHGLDSNNANIRNVE